MTLPKDPAMLLSFVNLKLRDFYKDLDSLCLDAGISSSDLCEKLKEIDYEYDKITNQFI